MVSQKQVVEGRFGKLVWGMLSQQFWGQEDGRKREEGRERQIGYVNECEGGDDWEVFWEVWKQKDIFFLLINLGYKESPHKQTP